MVAQVDELGDDVLSQLESVHHPRRRLHAETPLAGCRDDDEDARHAVAYGRHGAGHSAGSIEPSPPSGLGPPTAMNSRPSGPASSARTASGATRTTSHWRSSMTWPSTSIRPSPATTT